MDGFKTLPKMQCFKEGGSVAVKNIMKKGGIAKKGVPAVKEKDEGPKRQMVAGLKGTTPDVEDETTTTMKKGGRAKKAMVTVRKYKDGGAVGVYGAKKKSGDYDSIEKAKDIKPAKAAAPSKAAVKPAMKGSDVAKEKSKPAGSSKAKKVSDNAKMADAKSGAKGGPNKYKKGGEVKKMAAGSQTAPLATGPDSIARAHQLALMQEMRRLPPAMQLQLLQQQQRIGGTGDMNALANQMNPQPQQQPMPTNMGTMGQKRGGKVKKHAAGGKIGKIAAGLFPGALFGLPTAAAIYSNEKAKDAKVEEETAAKDKEAETKSAPVAKKRGGKATKVC